MRTSKAPRNRAKSHLNRDLRVIASTACPRCNAHVGEPCRRTDAVWPHSERRVAWSEAKRAKEAGDANRTQAH